MSESDKTIYIGVIGAGHCSKKVAKLAFEVGRRIAEANAVLVCGGLGGVMAAAAEGAKSAGGVTIGILPGTDRGKANSFIDHAIPTGLGEARNLLVVRSSDVVIALPGGSGTLSELAFALKVGKHVIDFGGWNVSDAARKASNAEEAVQSALQTTAQWMDMSARES
jgi:uncharacterized protein (TIGR00725 family)